MICYFFEAYKKCLSYPKDANDSYIVSLLPFLFRSASEGFLLTVKLYGTLKSPSIDESLILFMVCALVALLKRGF